MVPPTLRVNSDEFCSFLKAFINSLPKHHPMPNVYMSIAKAPCLVLPELQKYRNLPGQGGKQPPNWNILEFSIPLWMVLPTQNSHAGKMGAHLIANVFRNHVLMIEKISHHTVCALFMCSLFTL